MMEPQVKITSQIYFQRFRYGKENRGARKHREEDFMEVTLQNIPEGAVMKVFCVKAADELYPHPNSVDGHNCRQGVYCHPPLRRHCGEETLKIPWLQINRTKKQEMATALQNRLAELPQAYQGGCQALMESGVKMETNQVYLCVHVSWANHHGVSDVSKLIKNEDKSSVLKVDEVSPPSVSVDGGRILILMTEDSPCLEPEEIQVKIEEVDANKSIKWTSETFSPMKEDIRYKHVIAYQVPRYKDRQILEPVRVNVVIRCHQTDLEVRQEILYVPLPDFVALNRGKRKPSVAEKYRNKVLKVTDERSVKEELRNKIKSGGAPDLHCPPIPSLPPSGTIAPSMDQCVFENPRNAPNTDDNGLGSSNDLLSDELPDYPPQQAPVVQKEAGLYQAPQSMETGPNPIQEVQPLVRISLSPDTSSGSSRQFIVMDDNSSHSSVNMEHNLPQSVLELVSSQDSVPHDGILPTNPEPCDKLTMMKRCMHRPLLNQAGDSESAKMGGMHSTRTTDGNPSFCVQISEQNAMELSHGNQDFPVSGGHNPMESSPRNPYFHMHAFELNNLESSSGNSGLGQPGQGGTESSQGIPGLQIQHHDPSLVISNENPEQNGVHGPPRLSEPLPSLPGGDILELNTADLENMFFQNGCVFQDILQHPGETNHTSSDESDLG